MRIRRDGTGRGRLAAAAAACALLTAAAQPADAAQHKRAKVDCATAGKVVAASQQVRVYHVGDTYFACWLPTKRRMRLDAAYEAAETSYGLGDFAIAGRYLGYVGSVGGDRNNDSPHLVDVRAHKRVADPDVPDYDPESGATGITALVATRGGTMAWTGAGKACSGVHAVDATGETFTACGAASALARNGKRLFWLEGTEARTTVLKR